MERFRRRSSSADAGISFLERALDGLSTRRTNSPFGQRNADHSAEQSEPDEDFKGPLGLTLLHAPPEPLVDFIFVHGLGGGSRKTWSKTDNPFHYWPKEWLPRDPEFKNVRVFSFGYTADWVETKDSFLDMNDFAHSLLGEIKDNPEIRRDDSRIVLIGHSMGGLVVKKAYILARQDPAFKNLATRFHTAYFLATPHRGSDLARTLTNILKVTYTQKPFVNELERNSGLISAINDTFRHYAQDLQLWSFYETLKSTIMVSSVMVVDKTSATLGYAQERTALLNADHRGVCKFDRPSDPNYRTLRNALSATVEDIITEVFDVQREASRTDLRRLQKLIGYSDRPEDDLSALEDARISGSCNWFTSKQEFEDWRSPFSGSPPILWLSGNPASGKSVLAGHIVGHLEGQSLNCSYFFFKHGIASKSSIRDCLRSLAYQMALYSVDIRRAFLQLEADGVSFEKDDERAVWRKLFVGGLFQARSVQTHYWVIDALDECSKYLPLFSMLSNVGDRFPLRIFITSRKTPDIERAFGQLGKNVIAQDVLVSDTVGDIKLFVTANMDRLPVGDDKSRAALMDKILAKSSGSFIWVRLVIQELEHTWSEEAIEEVLNEIPADMNMLYARALENMSRVGRSVRLAKTSLTWIVCASRLLTVSELQCALKFDINETVHNLDKSISSICGQLVFVDKHSRIHMIHQTARDFLLQDGLNSEFAVRKTEGHMHLAVKCLEFLSGPNSKAPRTQNPKFGVKSGPLKDYALADYASIFFSDHLYRCSSLDSEPMDALYDFLEISVLSWIEYLSKIGDLSCVTHTATNIIAYLERRAKYFPPFGKQVQTVEAWSVDLIRISAKFRTNLLASPSSIYWLIPPMCPVESIIARKFTSPHRGLAVQGLHATTWDDCLTLIDFRGAQTTALRHGELYYAVGLASGNIAIYHSLTGQVNRTLEHGERVKFLEFGSQDRLLASGGLRIVHVWDLSNGSQLWSFSSPIQVLALAFTSGDECLMAASQGGYVICWELLDGSERVRVPWHNGIEEATGRIRHNQPATHAAFSPDRSLIASSSRGRPILLFDIESEKFLGNCIRHSGLGQNGEVTHYPVVALAFNPNPELSFLIASYGDGELTVWNPWTLELKSCVPAVNAQTLACSPDGRTLVTGGSFGTIQVFDFDGDEGEHMMLIYCINAHEDGIKSLAFSNDSLRFIDIRGSQCRVWGPAILVRKALQDGDQSEVSDPIPIISKSVTLTEEDAKADITAIACHADGETLFCGKQDGSISAYRSQDGQEMSTLYKHAINVAITCIAWEDKLDVVASADESGRIIISKIVKEQGQWSLSSILTDQRCTDSVRGLLICPTLERLLVSRKDVEEVWTLHGRKVGSKTFPPQKFRKPVSHPLEPETLIIFQPHTAKLLTWTDLAEIKSEEGIKLDRLVDPFAKNYTLSVEHQGMQILTELIKVSEDQSATRLECWQASDIHRNSLSLIPIPGFERLGPKIEHLITVIGTRLLFLDTELWVCSVDLQIFTKTFQAKRHFFIPPDWRSISGDMIFRFTSKNEFIFVKQNELAIIKRGLDYSEMVILSRPGDQSSNRGRPRPEIASSSVPATNPPPYTNNSLLTPPRVTR